MLVDVQTYDKVTPAPGLYLKPRKAATGKATEHDIQSGRGQHAISEVQKEEDAHCVSDKTPQP